MCGLAGVIGPSINTGTVRALMLVNQQRGSDATGFFNSMPKDNFIKNNDKAEVFLRHEDVRKWLEWSAKKAWAICGHTRGGTRGGNLQKNAHPFEYGPICGAHNGVLDAPVKYDVDSQYAMELLSKAPPGAYQEALGDVLGWYVLTWFDQRDQSVYFLNWQGDLRFQLIDGNVIYSSNGWHLATATGYDKSYEVKNGEVYRFRIKKGGQVLVKQLPDFTGKKREYTQQWNGHHGTTYVGGDYENYRGGSSYHRSSSALWMPPLGKGYTDLTGWVRKFQNGLWHAEQYNTRYQPIKAEGQAWLNSKYPDAKVYAQWCVTDINALESYVDRRVSYSPHQAESAKKDDKGLVKIEHTKKPAEEVAVTPSQLKSEAEQEAEQKANAWKGIDEEFERVKLLRIRRQALQNEGRGDDEIEAILDKEGLLEPFTYPICG